VSKSLLVLVALSSFTDYRFRGDAWLNSKRLTGAVHAHAQCRIADVQDLGYNFLGDTKQRFMVSVRSENGS
jgi:hypothetical protein